MFVTKASEWAFPWQQMTDTHESVLLRDAVNLRSDHWLQNVTLYWPHTFQQQRNALILLFCLWTSCLHGKCECVMICESTDICCLWSPCSYILTNISSVLYFNVQQKAVTELDEQHPDTRLLLFTLVLDQLPAGQLPVCILLCAYNTMILKETLWEW